MPAPYDLRVTSLAELNSALNSATGGERIQLANGDYGQLSRSSANPATSYVTISGESLAGVTVAGLALTNQSYLHFDNMTIDAQSTVETGGHFWLSGCKTAGLYCRNLHNQILEYNEFHSAEYCLVIADTNRSTHDILIHHNTIHGALIDCVEFAAGDGSFSGQIENITFRNNLIYDAALTAKYHGDGHQWWVYRKTFGSAGVKTFEILDNVYVIARAQCFFINFEASRSGEMAQNEASVLLAYSSPESRFGSFDATTAITSHFQAAGNYRARFTATSGTFSGVDVGDWLRVSGAAISDNNDDYFVSEKAGDGSWVNGIPRASMHDDGTIAGNFIVGNGAYAATLQGAVDVTFDENMVLGITDAALAMNIEIRDFSKAVVNANNIINTEFPATVSAMAEATLATPDVTLARNDLTLANHQDLCFVNPRTPASRFLPADWYPTPYLAALAPGHRAIEAIKALVAPPPFYLKLPDDHYDPADPLHIDLTAANITTGAALTGSTCVWNWDDGSATEVGVSVGHDFNIQGEYKVEATIGADMVERRVVVKSLFSTYLPLLSEGLVNHGWARDTLSEVGSISYPSPRLTAGSKYINGTIGCFSRAIPACTVSAKFMIPTSGHDGTVLYVPDVAQIRVAGALGLILYAGATENKTGALRLDQAPYLDTYNRITLVINNGTATAFLNNATTPFTTFSCASLIGPQSSTMQLGNGFSWDGNVFDVVMLPYALDCSGGADSAVLAEIAADEMTYDLPVAEDFSVTWDPDADGVMRVDVSSHVSVDASGDTPFDSEYISIPAGTITSGWEAKVEPKTGLIGISSTGGSLPASTDYAIYTNPGFLYAQGTITWTA